MSARRVVLHIGMSKTGTSALQVFFVRNREALAAAGVDYPAADSDWLALQGGTVSGNGVELSRFLVPTLATAAPEADHPRILATFRRQIAEADGTLLYSSEALYYLHHDRFAQLHQICVEAGASLEVVVFLRDIAEHALSEYAQSVKRQRCTETFSEFISFDFPPPTYDVRIRSQLEPLVELLGPAHVHAFHYAREKRTMAQTFLREVLGITELAGFELDPGQVNRSLTAREVEWMRLSNASFGANRDGIPLARLMMARQPLPSPPLTVSPEDVTALAARFDEQIAWVNEVLFDDASLEVQGSATLATETTALTIPDETAFLLDCLAEASIDITERGVKIEELKTKVRGLRKDLKAAAAPRPWGERLRRKVRGK